MCSWNERSKTITKDKHNRMQITSYSLKFETPKANPFNNECRFELLREICVGPHIDAQLLLRRSLHDETSLPYRYVDACSVIRVGAAYRCYSHADGRVCATRYMSRISILGTLWSCVCVRTHNFILHQFRPWRTNSADRTHTNTHVWQERSDLYMGGSEFK